METTFGYIRKESTLEKIVGRKIFWLIACSLLFAYPIYRSMNRTLPPELPVYGEMPSFTFTNDFGKSYGSENLKGNVYFVTLSSVQDLNSNPEFLKSLTKIQKRMRGVRQHASMITISLDPKNDTPKALNSLARKNQANPFYWSFLTTDEANLDSFLVNGLKKTYADFGLLTESGYLKEMIDARQITLVDRQGRIRGLYAMDKHSINKLMIDVGLMINRTKN